METLGTAVVEILGDLSRLAQALREAERQTKQGMKRAGEVGKRAFLAAFRGVKAALKTILVGAIAAVGSAITGLGAVIKSAFDYAPVENMRRAFEGLAVSAGSTGKAILNAMKEATGGTIAARDAMKAFNLAAQLVSVDFAMKLPEAMQYLQKVSAATGESMDFLLESLVRGVGRLSPMILDNLAIQVNLTEAYKAYAKQIGKSVNALTKQEKQMALMNQVLELLRRNTEAMPDVTDSAAVAWQRMKAAFQDTKDALGRLALPILSRVLGGLAERATAFAQAVQDLVNRIEEGQSVLIGVRNVLEAAFGKAIGARIFDIVVKAMRLFRAFQEGGIMGEKFRQVLAEIFGPDAANTIMRLVEGFQKFTEILRQVWAAAVPFFQDVVIPFIREHSREILAALLAIGAVLGGAAILGGIASIAGALATLLNPLTLVVAAVGLLAAAWAGNWGGIRDKILQAWAVIRPILARLWNWLRVNIPRAIQAVAAFWQNVLQPALAAMGTWIKTELIPVWQSFWSSLMTIGGWIADRFVAIWQNLLWPAIQRVWDIISAKLMPAWDVLWDKMKNLQSRIAPFKKAWEGVQAAFKKVWEIIKKVVDWFGRLANKLQNIKLPEWLQRHSPAPIELAFAGWRKHLRAVTLELPRLERHLDVLDRAGVVNQTQRVSNWNITLQQVAGPEEFLNMLRLAQATEGF